MRLIFRLQKLDQPAAPRIVQFIIRRRLNIVGPLHHTLRASPLAPPRSVMALSCSTWRRAVSAFGSVGGRLGCRGRAWRRRWRGCGYLRRGSGCGRRRHWRRGRDGNRLGVSESARLHPRAPPAEWSNKKPLHKGSKHWSGAAMAIHPLFHAVIPVIVVPFSSRARSIRCSFPPGRRAR